MKAKQCTKQKIASVVNSSFLPFSFSLESPSDIFIHAMASPLMSSMESMTLPTPSRSLALVTKLPVLPTTIRNPSFIFRRSRSLVSSPPTPITATILTLPEALRFLPHPSLELFFLFETTSILVVEGEMDWLTDILGD